MESEGQRIADVIAKHGWCASSIPDSPFGPFIYTAGLLTTVGHPELIVFGLQPETGYAVLAAMVEDIRGGVSFRSGEPIDGVLEGVPVKTRLVDPSQHPMFFGDALGHVRDQEYEGAFEALQVLWPDAEGHFPQDPACHPQVRQRQPSIHVPLASSEREWYAED